MQHRRCITQLLLTTLAAVVLATGSSAAQDTAASAHAASLLPPYRYRVLGVFDAASGQPVADADVADILTGASATTSRTGTVALSFLPDGGGLVRIRKFGYAMQTLAVSVSPADTTPVTVVLTPAVRLPGVTTHGRSSYISPNLRGFEDRRLHGATGYFIPDSVLRKEEERPLANVLESHVPGINILHSGSRTMLMKSGRCTNGGMPDVYLDGVKLKHPPPPPDPKLMNKYIQDLKKDPGSTAEFPFDLSAFHVTTLGGVEYYPDNTMLPPQFDHTSRGCGALLLWTREK